MNPFDIALEDEDRPSSNPFDIDLEGKDGPSIEMEDIEDRRYKRRLDEARNLIPKEIWNLMLMEADPLSVLSLSRTNNFFSQSIKKNNVLWNELIKLHLTKNPKLNPEETPYQYLLRHKVFLNLTKDKILKEDLYKMAERGMDVLFLTLYDNFVKEAKLQKLNIFKNILLNCAAKAGNIIILQKIIDSGVSIEINTITFRMDEMVYLGTLHYAVENGAYDCLNLLYGTMKNVPGFNINDTNRDKESALHVAAKKGHMACVKFLITNGAQLDLQTPEGKNAYHLAKYYKKYDCAECLAEAMKEKGIPVKDFNTATAFVDYLQRPYLS